MAGPLISGPKFWLPREGIMKPIVSLGSNPAMMMSDLIDPTSMSWKKEVLEQNFFWPLMQSLFWVFPYAQIIWRTLGCNYEKKGSFFVTSAYRILIVTKRGEGVARGNFRFVW